MVQLPARLPTVRPCQENKEVYKSFLSSHAHFYRTLHIQMYDRFYLSAYPAIPSGTYQGQKINNSEHTMTPVSIAFRWAMLCTKSELRFRQYSFNHRTRNLRSVEVLRLTPYPLYQHAIVPFEFPRQVGWLFPLFTFNNVPLRGRYTFALSSAQS